MQYKLRVFENGTWVTKTVTRADFLHGIIAVEGSRGSGMTLAATVMAYRIKLLMKSIAHILPGIA